MQKLTLILVGVLALAVLVQGCERIQARERAVILSNSTNGYRKAIRWGEFDLALQVIRRRDGAAPAYDPELLKKIRVTSYEFLKRDISLEGNEAELVAALSYYNVETGRVVKMQDRQLWWFDEATKHWYIDGQLPDFAGGLGQ